MIINSTERQFKAMPATQSRSDLPQRPTITQLNNRLRRVEQKYANQRKDQTNKRLFALQTGAIGNDKHNQEKKSSL